MTNRTDRAEPRLTIRPMRRAELDLAVDWAAREGWNPGLRDADAFWAQDPGGFMIALADDEPAATISVVRYGPDFAFLGFYIAAPEWRGRGIAMALWQAAVAGAGPRGIGLDGVVDQQANYRRSGFALSHRNIRFQGAVPAAAPDPQAGDITPLTAVTPDVAAVDARAFGALRPAFLGTWLTTPGHRALGLRRDGRIVGYGVSRPCRTGTKIGPLFAPDEAGARALLAALAAGRDAPIIWDVPEPNAAALGMAQEFGMTASFETARMYRGPAPASDASLVFGVTTFELG